FNGSGRTWIKSDNPLVRSALKEKRHADGNGQAIPLTVAQLKLRKESNPLWHPLILCFAATAEEKRTWSANAENLAAHRIEQVLMLWTKRRRAKLATFENRTLTRETAERMERSIAGSGPRNSWGGVAVRIH